MFKIFSPNMLKTFETCSKKFYLKYVKNISMPVNDDIFEFGKNIHVLASYYLRKEDISKLEKTLSSSESLVWECLKKNKYMQYETLGTELNLSVKIGSYFFGGRLDALVKDSNGRYLVLDYKTGSIPKNPKQDFQTIIYLLAVKSYYGTSDVGFVYLDLKNNAEIVIELTEKLIKEYEERLLNIADTICKSDFSNLKTSNCRCEYDVICYY